MRPAVGSCQGGWRRAAFTSRRPGDSLTVIGCGAGGVEGGATCEAHFDHRIAMSFLCLGLATRNPVTVDDTTAIATSFPRFVTTMTSLGAELA